MFACRSNNSNSKRLIRLGLGLGLGLGNATVRDLEYALSIKPFSSSLENVCLQV
jgi:hypothetical protein